MLSLLSPGGVSFSGPDSEGSGAGRCAVVGNGQRTLLTSHGRLIDQSDVVLRLNQAPGGEPAEEYIGSKTTHRMINQQWTIAYGEDPPLPPLFDGSSVPRMVMIESLWNGPPHVIVGSSLID
eukprot:5154586-Pyramimonas_sp.AAC.1